MTRDKEALDTLTDGEVSLDDFEPAPETKQIINPTVGAMSDGMSYQEAYHRAALWWNRTGRKRMKKIANYREEGRKYSHGKVAIRVAPDLVPEMTESGIMMGRMWDNLTMREKARVAVVWHQEFIIKPALDKSVLPE